MPTSDGMHSWAKVTFDFWERLAQSGRFPKWQTVAYFAYAHMGTNGHAPFAGDDLARLVFPDVDTTTGEVLKVPAEKNRRRLLRRHIADAVTNGLLIEGSEPECLIVPEGISMGDVKNRYGPCRVHGRRTGPRA